MNFSNFKPLIWSVLKASILLSVTLLSGCLSTPISTNGYPLADQQHWQVKARVSIRTPDDNVAATLDWQKQGKTFDFHLYGTFGVTYAHLIQQQDQAVLKLPDDQVFYDQNAQQLLDDSLGWNFPIDALASWIKGLPSFRPGEQISRNTEGQLSEALLNGWRVEFSRYQDYSGYSMPRIIVANHPQMTLKLVVRDWTFLPDSRLEVAQPLAFNSHDYAAIPPVLPNLLEH